MTQESLAEAVGVDRKTISRTETGTYSVHLDVVFAVANVLAIDPVVLFQPVDEHDTPVEQQPTTDADRE